MRGLIGFYLIALVINILVNIAFGGNAKSIIIMQLILALLMAGACLLAD